MLDYNKYCSNTFGSSINAFKLLNDFKESVIAMIKDIHASIQLCSKQSCPEKTTTWGEEGLFIQHLTVHIPAHHCMEIMGKVLLLFYIYMYFLNQAINYPSQLLSTLMMWVKILTFQSRFILCFWFVLLDFFLSVLFT